MSFKHTFALALGILGLQCSVRGVSAAAPEILHVLPKIPQRFCGYTMVAKVGVKQTFTFSANMKHSIFYYNDACEWKFVGENGNRIGYVFVYDFVIFKSPGCKKDFVSLRDTESEHSLIGKYCSPRKIPQTKRTTVSFTLIVKFQSNTGRPSRFSIRYWAFKQPKSCSATMYQGLEWPKASAGESVSIRCHTAGHATWLCDEDGNYDSVGPILDKDCITENLEETVKGMSSSAKEGTSSKELLQQMMHIADRMFSPDMSDTWKDLPFDKRNQLLHSLTSSIEQSALKIALVECDNETLTITEGQIVVNVQTLAANQHQNVTFCPDDTTDDGPMVHLDFDDTRDSRTEPISAVIVIYRNMSGMLGLNASSGFSKDGANMTFEKNFMTVSLYQNDSSKLNATNNIVMSYTIPKTTLGDIGDRHCVFWDGAYQRWSGAGCRLTQVTLNKTTCACDHLTFFAVLMDISGSSHRKGDENPMSVDTERSLVILTYIGCGLSIVCLFIAIVCFYLLRSIWCQRITIHRNLCINLLLGQILFVAAVDQTEEKTFCAVVAGVLHFLFLAAFSWMCLEGVQLYLMLVKVLPLKHSRIVWFYMCGYGVPGLIVSVSSAIYPEGYGTTTCCWLTHTHYFIWAFTGPVLLVMVINILFLMQTLRVIYKVGHGKIRTSHPKTYLQCLRRAAKGAVLLQCILGTTWIIGYGYQGQSTIAFAYVFTILNSTQGVFIFIFHVATNDKVLKAIKEKLELLRECRFGKGSPGSSVCSNSGTAQKQRRVTPANPFIIPKLAKTAMIGKTSELTKSKTATAEKTSELTKSKTARAEKASEVTKSKTARTRKTSKIEPTTHPNSVNLSVASLAEDTHKPTASKMMVFLENKVSSSPTLFGMFDKRDSERGLVLNGEEHEVKTLRGGRFSLASGDSGNSNMTIVSIITI